MESESRLRDGHVQYGVAGISQCLPSKARYTPGTAILSSGNAGICSADSHLRCLH